MTKSTIIAALLVGSFSIVAPIAVGGCSWLSGGGGTGQVIASGGGIGACIINQETQGVTDPGQIVAACSGAALQDVVQITESLIAYYLAQAKAAGDAGVGTASPPTARLYSIAAAARAQMADAGAHK